MGGTGDILREFRGRGLLTDEEPGAGVSGRWVLQNKQDLDTLETGMALGLSPDKHLVPEFWFPVFVY